MRKVFIIFVLGGFVVLLNRPAMSQELESNDQSLSQERLTQEEFAVELVKTMNLDSRLPTAALPSDCVSLLEKSGIMPLNGWHNKVLLAKEDYLVILAKLHGKGRMVYERAAEIERKNIEVINQKWKESFKKEGRWLLLSKLLSNRTYFPEGEPKSPFGISYQDINDDHQVDKVFLPFLGLVKFTDRLLN